MNLLPHIVFFAGLGIYIIGRAIDYHSSQKFWLWGTYEGTKLLRDENGFFDSKKYVIYSALGLIIPFGIYLFGGEAGGYIGGAMAIVGVVSGLRGMKNLKNRERRRADQTRLLENLNAGVSFTITLRKHGGKRYFSHLFGSFSTDEQNYEKALEVITRRLRALAAEPKDKWFDEATQNRIQREVN